MTTGKGICLCHPPWQRLFHPCRFPRRITSYPIHSFCHGPNPMVWTLTSPRTIYRRNSNIILRCFALLPPRRVESIFENITCSGRHVASSLVDFTLVGGGQFAFYRMEEGALGECGCFRIENLRRMIWNTKRSFYVMLLCMCPESGANIRSRSSD